MCVCVRKCTGARHMQFINVPGMLLFPFKNFGFRYRWGVILCSATYNLTILSIFFIADIQIV